MKLEELEELIWECYNIQCNDDYEMKNNNNNNQILRISKSTLKNIEKDEKISEKENNPDVRLIDMLDELYYLVALENIDTYEGFESKKAEVNELDELSTTCESLVHFKKFYYEEMQKSIKAINGYLQNGGIVECDIRRLKRVVSDFERKREYYDTIYDIIYDIYDACELCVWRDEESSPKLFKELFDAVFDIQIYAHNYGKYSCDIENVGLWLKLFLVLRKRKFGYIGQIIWIMFLVGLGNCICDCKEDISLPKIDFDRDWIRQLNVIIRETFNLVERKLTERIVYKQQAMVFCYLQRPMELNNFDDKVEKLITALEQGNEKFKYYLGKSAKGCIAMMHFQSKHYIALSGSEETNGYGVVLEQLMGHGYVFVGLNAGVRFYYNKKGYVTYEQYILWKEGTGVDENQIKKLKRMFSCCERKLITKLYEKENVHYTIYVAKQPCPMCKKAMVDLENDKCCSGLIRYPKRKKKSSTPRTDFDAVAKCIRDYTAP